MKYFVHGLVLLVGSGLALAVVEPPDVINYQAVLRDAADHPVSGDFEMIFRFYDSDIGGSELARDEHCALAGPAPCVVKAGAVTVTGGLFDGEVGGGGLVEGTGRG